LQSNFVIASVDKDLDQIAGWHYNFVKKIGYNITPEEGMYRFYKQILTGDSADNIIGIRGVGPVTADKLLSEATDEMEMYAICLEQYEGNEERVIENARLLWLRRYEDELWQPPMKDTV
jgi:DNA polymerase-1